MTLITFVQTTEYAVLASDRRLTVTSGRRTLNQEDRATKGFVLWGQMLMGFTGIAILDGEPMESWATAKLADALPNEGPEVLASAMDAYYAAHPEVRPHAHHFQALGFAYNPTASPQAWAMGFGVGNAQWTASRDRVSASGVQPRFRVVRNLVGNQGPIVGAVGSPYSLGALQRLRKTVSIAVRANPLDPSYIFEPMVDFTRETASRSGGTVGEVVTVCSIPRTGIPFPPVSVSVPLQTADYSAARMGPFSHTYYPPDVQERTEFLPATAHYGIATAGATIALGTEPVTPPGF